jgi:hypothetical protein
MLKKEVKLYKSVEIIFKCLGFCAFSLGISTISIRVCGASGLFPYSPGCLDLLLHAISGPHIMPPYSPYRIFRPHHRAERLPDQSWSAADANGMGTVCMPKEKVLSGGQPRGGLPDRSILDTILNKVMKSYEGFSLYLQPLHMTCPSSSIW